MESIPQIIDAGTQLLTSLIGALPQIITDIVNAIASLGYMLVEAGSNLIRGLRQGISNMGDWIWSKIKGFMGGIVDGIKSFFGIRSPSALFAGLGENMAQGLGIGFAEQMNQVARDMQNAIPQSFGTDINASMNVSGGGARSGGGAGGTVINQSISVTTPKPLSERELAREFKNLSRKLAMEV